MRLNQAVLDDASLSYKAKGIYFSIVFFKKYHSDYVTMWDLLDSADIGMDSLRRGIKELEAKGYLKREQRHELNGRFYYYYDLTKEEG